VSKLAKSSSEFRVTAETAGQHKAGGVIAASSVFSVGQKVDVQGTSIGKGFAGTIKRHNMKLATRVAR
jgi:large subunit ribosomal protein L3